MRDNLGHATASQFSFVLMSRGGCLTKDQIRGKVSHFDRRRDLSSEEKSSVTLSLIMQLIATVGCTAFSVFDLNV